MKFRRSILFILLVPLLLELLLIFTARPVDDAGELSFCPRGEHVVVEGFLDADEELEEAEAFSLSQPFNGCRAVTSAPCYSRRIFHIRPCAAVSLSLGWRIPLRI